MSNSKPRIIRHRCILAALGQWSDCWACFMPAPNIGWRYPWKYGRTPSEAYARWKRAYDKLIAA